MFIITQYSVAKPTDPHLICKGLCRPHASLKCIVASDSVKVNAEAKMKSFVINKEQK